MATDRLPDLYHDRGDILGKLAPAGSSPSPPAGHRKSRRRSATPVGFGARTSAAKVPSIPSERAVTSPAII